MAHTTEDRVLILHHFKEFEQPHVTRSPLPRTGSPAPGPEHRRLQLSREGGGGAGGQREMLFSEHVPGGGELPQQ